MTNQELADIRERVTRYIQDNGRTQSSVAKMIGLSTAVMSGFLNSSYTGDNVAVARKLLTVIEADEKRHTAVLEVREPELVETSVMKKIDFGIQYASSRNDVVIVYGPPGIGKTATIKHYVQKTPTAIFFTASPNIANGQAVMNEILDIIGKNAKGKQAKENAIKKALNDSNRMIIVDEAHFLTVNGLETLRIIHDATKCPVVLIGNPKIMEMITERNKTITGQFFSRAVRISLDGKVSMDEVERIVNQNGVNLAQECLQELHKVANAIGALRVMTKLLLFA